MVRMAWGVRRRRTGLPRASLISRVDCRFGMKRRFVLLLAWLTRCPVWTPLPEIEQRRDMAESSRKSRKRGNVGPGRGAVVRQRSDFVKGGRRSGRANQLQIITLYQYLT